MGVFERYDEEARRAVFYARLEAGHAGAKFITPAHLVVGLSRDHHVESCPVYQLRLNVSELRSRLGLGSATTAEDLKLTKGDIALDDNSKMALAYAVKEADWDRQYWIGPEHLLRGMLRFPNETSSALRAIGVDLESLRATSRSHRKLHPPKRPPLLGFVRRVLRKFLLPLATALIVVIITLLVKWLN
jgi:ATP-dependent Clp protease ATP-binding subunit ClpA